MALRRRPHQNKLVVIQPARSAAECKLLDEMQERGTLLRGYRLELWPPELRVRVRVQGAQACQHRSKMS